MNIGNENYEEALIDGNLFYRSSPDEPWKVYTPSEVIAIYMATKTVLDRMIHLQNHPK